jgi:hypothetical protein
MELVVGYTSHNLGTYFESILQTASTSVDLASRTLLVDQALRSVIFCPFMLILVPAPISPWLLGLAEGEPINIIGSCGA